MSSNFPPVISPEAYRTALQAAHDQAKERATALCIKQPGIITIYALGDAIADIEATQIRHIELREVAEAIALGLVMIRLKSLLPIR